MSSAGDNDFTTISALAVSPDGTKLAVHGQHEIASGLSSSGYLFILDTASGAQISGILKETFNSGSLWRVRNFATLVNDDGFGPITPLNNEDGSPLMVEQPHIQLKYKANR